MDGSIESREIAAEVIQHVKKQGAFGAESGVQTLSQMIQRHGLSVVFAVVFAAVMIWQWHETNKRYDRLQNEIQTSTSMQLERSTVAIERSSDVLQRIEVYLRENQR